MKSPIFKQSQGRHAALLPAISFVVMISSVVLICRGFALPGIPAFLISLLPLVGMESHIPAGH